MVFLVNSTILFRGIFIVFLGNTMAPALEYLHCGGNRIEALDLHGFSRLRILECGDNALMELRLGDNTALEYLDAPRNQLREVDVSSLINAAWMDFSNNRLESVASFALNPGLDRHDYVNVKYNHLDCGDWPDIRALVERMGEEEIILDYDLVFHHGIGYSPQHQADPYHCSTVEGWWDLTP